VLQIGQKAAAFAAEYHIRVWRSGNIKMLNRGLVY